MRDDARLDSGEAVALYVRVLRNRASAVYGVRAVCCAFGAASLALVVAAALCGPVVTPWSAAIALGIMGALLAGVFGAVVWPLRRLRGSGSCQLLSQHEPVLASRVRSALELRGSDASPALVAAHARAVRDAIALVPPSRVVPLSRLHHPTVLAGVAALGLSALLLWGSDGLRHGAQALLNPARVRPDGVRIGAVVTGATARLIYPSYLARKPSELGEVGAIRAPRGTSVELVVQTRFAAQQGAVELGGTRIRMSAAPNGRLFARFVVRESGALKLRVFDDGVWYEDERARQVQALEDQKPEASLELPEASTTVEVQSSVPLRLKATDDHGLNSIDLVIRSAAGDEERRRLWSTLRAGQPETTVQEDVSLVPAELGAQPGDSLLLWLEARDGDVVSGPNVGISKTLKLDIATDAQRLSLRLPLLREVLDGALESLADRLESSVPEQNNAAQQRVQELHAFAATWLGDLERLVVSTRSSSEEKGLDVDQLQGVLDRTRRELGRESGGARSSVSGHKSLVDADARVVTEHERDVLLLSDMLSQGLVDEARALAQELGELKTHVAELLRELKTKRSPEAQRALLAEIAKVQRRLRELAQSLARLSNRVPSEFINREALPQDDTGQALEQLRASVEAGDLDAAERQLKQLAQGIDGLSQHIESGGARFREAHFGARDKAISSARRELDMLSAEQNRLAERSHDLVRRAVDRAKGRGAQGASADMKQAADALEQELRALDDPELSGGHNPLLERARDRLRDVRDAMRTGDLAAARRMSAQAAGSLEQAAASLEQDAEMFPGQRGQTSARAQAANDAAAKLRKLQRQIEQAMPQLGQFVGEQDRKQLRQDLDPQQRARRKAEQLQNELERGQDGAPLSPSGDQGLKAAAEAMQRAERALDRGDPQAASMAQQDASEQLRQVEERLRKRGGQDGARENAGGEAEGPGREGMRSDAPVRIPRADEFSGPVQMRRRLLDAMREAAPAEFRSAVKRYYEELLR